MLHTGALNECFRQEATGVSVRLDYDEIREQDEVLFLRKAASGKVAFEAVCKCPAKYYLHSTAIAPGMETRDYLIGQVFLLEDEGEGGVVMVYASFKEQA